MRKIDYESEGSYIVWDDLVGVAVVKSFCGRFELELDINIDIMDEMGLRGLINRFDERNRSFIRYIGGHRHNPA